MLKRICLSVAMLCFVINSSGCIFLAIPLAVGVVAGAGIGIGTAKWMSDKLVEQVPYTFDRTIQGVKDGLLSMKLVIVKETVSDSLVQFNSTYSDGRTVWINVERVKDKVTKIEVRVGVWGGQKEANVILDGILSQLK